MCSLIAVSLVVKTTEPSPTIFNGIMNYLSVQESENNKTKLLGKCQPAWMTQLYKLLHVNLQK